MEAILLLSMLLARKYSNDRSYLMMQSVPEAFEIISSSTFEILLFKAKLLLSNEKKSFREEISFSSLLRVSEATTSTCLRSLYLL